MNELKLRLKPFALPKQWQEEKPETSPSRQRTPSPPAPTTPPRRTAPAIRTYMNRARSRPQNSQKSEDFFPIYTNDDSPYHRDQHWDLNISWQPTPGLYNHEFVGEMQELNYYYKKKTNWFFMNNSSFIARFRMCRMSVKYFYFLFLGTFL